MFGKNLDVSPLEMIFVLVLHKNSSLSGAEIVDHIQIGLGDEWKPTPGATYKIIRSLESKGFIQETTSNEDRKDNRIRTYALSEKGECIVPTISQRFSKVVVFMGDCCSDCCPDLNHIINLPTKIKTENHLNSDE